jgi:hypothetical protein
MKVVPLLLSCVLILSACNQSPENATPAPAKTQAISNKLLIVTVGGKTGSSTEPGKSSSTHNATDFAEGLAMVCVGPCDHEHWQGYRYTKGLETETLEQTFKYGYIDETGKMVINPMFESAEMFGEGLAAVCVGHGCYYSLPSDKPKEEGKWGYIDKTGKFVINPQYDSASPFDNGLLWSG